MGLIISHGCYEGSHSRYMSLLQSLAKTINICLPLMEGFYQPLETIRDREEKQILATLIVQEMIRTAQIPLIPYKWAMYPIDPLHDLFMVGNNKIPKEHCIILAKRLERLLYEDEFLAMFNPIKLNHYNISLIEQFIKGLKDAASKNEDVIIGE